MAGRGRKKTARITKKKSPPRLKSFANSRKKVSRPFSKITPTVRKKNIPKKVQRKIARPADVLSTVGEFKTRLYSSGDIQAACIEPAPFFKDIDGELPAGYGDHFIYLMVRDPQWLYAYWEIQKPLESNALQQLGGNWDKVRSVLRIYHGAPECSGYGFFDIEMTPGAANWFIEVAPNQSYIVEIGLRHEAGRFIALVRSNKVTTPRVTMSEVLDEEWMGIDFEKMYALSGGFELGKSSEALKKIMQERLRSAVTSGSKKTITPAGVRKTQMGFPASQAKRRP